MKRPHPVGSADHLLPQAGEGRSLPNHDLFRYSSNANMPKAVTVSPLMQETIDSTNAATSILFLGHTGEWWDFCLIISVVIAALAATAIGVATTGSIISHKREAEYAEKALKHFKLETEEKISDANARTAEATEEAQKAQLELVRRTAPRTLGPTRQQEVAIAVRQFAGQRYRVAISQGADDGIAFWESLYVTLKEAGWVCIPMPPGQPAVGNPPAGIPIAAAPGIEIVFDPAKETELSASALALGNALHADGTVVAVNRDNHSNPDKAQQDVLLIRIGPRVPRE
ncbi:MAG: hypothetical protein ACYC5H_09230 [Methylovirgula sp.]